MFVQNYYINSMIKNANNENVYTNNIDVCEKTINSNLFDSPINFKGFEIVPSFDGSARLNTYQVKFLPDYSVVYIFHDLRGIYYIGETQSLSDRFHQHLNKKNNKELVQMISNPIHEGFISWIRVDTYQNRIELEKRLIKFFQPTANNILFKRSQ